VSDALSVSLFNLPISEVGLSIPTQRIPPCWCHLRDYMASCPRIPQSKCIFPPKHKSEAAGRVGVPVTVGSNDYPKQTFRDTAVRIQFVYGHSECFVGTVLCLFDQNRTWVV
jgi:hypothetical protein